MLAALIFPVGDTVGKPDVVELEEGLGYWDSEGVAEAERVCEADEVWVALDDSECDAVTVSLGVPDCVGDELELRVSVTLAETELSRVDDELGEHERTAVAPAEQQAQTPEQALVVKPVVSPNVPAGLHSNNAQNAR